MNLAADVTTLVCLAVIIVIYRAYKEVNERSLASTVPEGALIYSVCLVAVAIAEPMREVIVEDEPKMSTLLLWA